MAAIFIKRGTRAQVDAAAGTGGLHEGELYLITDEDRVAVGTGTSTYTTFAKLSELGGGSSETTGTVTLDFGLGANEAQVTVTGQAGITPGSKVSLTVSADATSTSHTANDHRYFLQFCSLTTGTPVAATGFTIYARSAHKLTGTWTIQYRWQ